MPKNAAEIKLTEQEYQQLKIIANRKISEVRQSERAKIILACSEGKQNIQIANEIKVSVPTVCKWRKRFRQKRLEGLRDNPRPGRPSTYDSEFRSNIFKLIRSEPPPGLVRWDCGVLAEKVGSSVHAVWRVLKKEGIHLERARSWCISTDPEFSAKAADIVGLYLNPPENALILSLDEKPSIQALERTTGYIETDDGKLTRAYKSTYKRHGTLNLFAALDIATGHVYSETTKYKKREDFQNFLGTVLKGLPSAENIHVILDNYSTHKKNDEWLKQYDGRVTFHFTPTSASWLNQVEIWFGILSRKTLKDGSFASIEHLKRAIEAFIERYNKTSHPFKWRKREVRGSQIKNTLTNLCN